MQTMYPGMVNSPQTELAQAIDDQTTTIPLVDASKLPPAPNLAVIGTGEDAETVLYEGVDGNDLTGVTRGFQGTAKAWPQGAKVARTFTAYDYDALRENVEDHTASTSAHGATSEATPNRIVMRDSAGRFKAAAPSASDDVARKAEVDAVQTNLNNHANATTGVHGATSAATPNTIVQRDAEGNLRTRNRVYFSNDDYIEFDDSTDTFSFFDDSDGSGGAQDSNIRAGRIRLTVTSDVSETSTNHAFQIGPDDSLNLAMDTNEIMVRDGQGGMANLHINAEGGAVTINNTAAEGGFMFESGRFYIKSAQFIVGSGSPNGSVAAPPGSIYLNTAGGAGTTLYYKSSGTGNTGWQAVA